MNAGNIYYFILIYAIKSVKSIYINIFIYKSISTHNCNY